MGAKKWSTILKQNYDKTGRLWNNCSLEEEIKYYTDASFRNPNELIIWADSYHFTIKWFCFIYFRRFPDTNLSASIVSIRSSTSFVTGRNRLPSSQKINVKQFKDDSSSGTEEGVWIKRQKLLF